MKPRNTFGNMDERKLGRLFVAFVLVLYIVSVALTMDATAPVAADTTGYITDRDITTHVESEFSFDTAVVFNKVNVKTDAGIVTLTGTVTNILAKHRAARIAETVRGVRSVINRIEIDPLSDKSAQKIRH